MESKPAPDELPGSGSRPVDGSRLFNLTDLDAPYSPGPASYEDEHVAPLQDEVLSDEPVFLGPARAANSETLDSRLRDLDAPLEGTAPRPRGDIDVDGDGVVSWRPGRSAPQHPESGRSESRRLSEADLDDIFDDEPGLGVVPPASSEPEKPILLASRPPGYESRSSTSPGPRPRDTEPIPRSRHTEDSPTDPPATVRPSGHTPPPTPPRQPASPEAPRVRDTEYEITSAIEKVARAAKKAEAGRGRRKTLRNAQEELRDAILNAETRSGEKIPASDKLIFAIQADEKIEELRSEYAGEKVGIFTNIIDGVTRRWTTKPIAKLMKKYPKSTALGATLLVAGAVAGTIVSGGLALGVLAPAAAVGGVLGGARKYVNARYQTAQDNLKGNVVARWSADAPGSLKSQREAMLTPMLTSGMGDTALLNNYINKSHSSRYEAVSRYKTKNTKRVVGATALGTVVGAVAAPLAAAGVVGLKGGAEVLLQNLDGFDIGDLNPFDNGEGSGANPEVPAVQPEVIGDGIRTIIENDPTQLKNIPGFENVDVDLVTEQEAAATYKGRYSWGALQNGAKLSNGETLKSFVDGWTELHGQANVKVNTWGDIKFSGGKYHTTGDLWGGKVTADNLMVIDSNGDIDVFNGELGKAQQADLLDALRNDGQILDTTNEQQMSKFISDHVAKVPDQATVVKPMLDAQADIIADDFVGDMQGVPAGDAAQSQAVLQASISEYVGNAPQQFIKMSTPDLNRYLAGQINNDVQAFYGANNTPAWVNPEAIQRMIDESVKSMIDESSNSK